ncbi:MAG: hypothetical protein KKH83_08350 [Candidatus Margulisbacteria bacterium]|nr:hypothetical protein [Candidatus Margulisiibacteriota bacterium]
MKKLFGCMMIVSFVLGLAVVSRADWIDEKREKLTRELVELERLEAKADARQKAVMRKKIAVMKARIAKFNSEYPAAAAAPARPMAPAAAVPPSAAPKAIKVEAVKEKRAIAQAKRRGMEIGVSAGLIASMPGAFLEMQNNFPFGELKYGVGYAQGDDSEGTTRKHALVFLSMARRFTPANFQGVRPYWAIGLNYNAYTSGQKSGSLGYQANLGFESDLSPTSAVYLDLGYGVVRTGFSPDFNGVNAQIGYRAIL